MGLRVWGFFLCWALGGLRYLLLFLGAWEVCVSRPWCEACGIPQETEKPKTCLNRVQALGPYTIITQGIETTISVFAPTNPAHVHVLFHVRSNLAL